MEYCQISKFEAGHTHTHTQTHAHRHIYTHTNTDSLSKMLKLFSWLPLLVAHPEFYSHPPNTLIPGKNAPGTLMCSSLCPRNAAELQGRNDDYVFAASYALITII